MKKLLTTVCSAAITLAAVAAPTITLEVAPEHRILPADTEQEIFIRVKLAVPDATTSVRQAQKLDLAVALDVSGSMHGQNKIENAILAAQKAVDMLANGDTFCLVTYSSNAQLLIPVTVITPSSRQSLKNTISRVITRGNTALYAGVSLAADQLIEIEAAPGRVRRVILLSDGQANEGPSSPAELGHLGAQLFRHGLTVTTIGLGNDYNEDLMTALAHRGSGNFYFVGESAELAGILESELAATFKVVGVCDGWKAEAYRNIPIGILDSDSAELASSITIDEGRTLYSGNDAYWIIKAKLPPMADRSKLDICNVTINYRDADGKTHALSAAAQVEFSAAKAKHEKSLNSEVRGDVVLAQSAVLRAQAVEHADAGDFSAAGMALVAARESVLANQDHLPASVAYDVSSSLAADEANVQEAVRAPETYKATRKEMQGKAFQERNQQVNRQ